MKPLGDVLEYSNISLRQLVKGHSGVTGLETAIILIAFVVVASVFAFTVLSTGIFSAERGREAVFAGLKQASGTVESKGSVIARGVVQAPLSNAEVAWTSTPDVTALIDSNSRKQGAYSASLVIEPAFTTGLAAYESLSPPVDLSRTDAVQVWVRASKATSRGDLQLRLSSTADCGVAAEDIVLPALAADTWRLAVLGVTDTTVRDAIACVGLVVATDLSPSQVEIVSIDEIYGLGQATEVLITLANAVAGEPVDLTEPSDSDGDGIADVGDQRHGFIVTYVDSRQIINDMFWSKNFVGASDEDDLLEIGEKVEITISLEGLAQSMPLTESVDFRLEVKPAEGSVLPFSKIMPGQIDPVMTLQ